MKEKVHKFWKNLAPTLNNMVLNKDIDNYDSKEREEVLSYLPNFEGKKVLELASGIGRFTGSLAEKGAHVESIDYASHFLETNQKTHKNFTNIHYQCIDAIDLDYPKDSFDLIFINWLFLYFTDQQLPYFFDQLKKWLTPGGYLFFRESCFSDMRNYEREEYMAIYRFHFEYEAAAKTTFEIIQEGMIETYIKHRNLTNQYYWLCQKKC
ncbi:MAG: methyltransferase domain-containing protein [Simkaniaceae bacterium]|nr:MAG: methyltransferase domain-containing protein [Simkaniaceae bacterium]